MRTKTIELEIKAIGENGDGRFQGYASVFGNIDSYGDVVIKGAFEESLKDFGAKGAGIPCYWQHRMDDPFMNVGETVTAEEDDHGLLVDVQLDLETNNGKQVFRLLKAKRVKQMSFAYEVLEGAWIHRAESEGPSYYEIRKVRLIEVSVVQAGANAETEITGVKTALVALDADTKTGRRLSADERSELVDAAKALTEVLARNEAQEPADEPTDAKPEEPEVAKGEEPTTVKAARALATNTLIQTL